MDFWKITDLPEDPKPWHCRVLLRSVLLPHQKVPGQSHPFDHCSVRKEGGWGKRQTVVVLQVVRGRGPGGRRQVHYRGQTWYPGFQSYGKVGIFENAYWNLRLWRNLDHEDEMVANPHPIRCGSRGHLRPADLPVQDERVGVLPLSLELLKRRYQDNHQRGQLLHIKEEQEADQTDSTCPVINNRSLASGTGWEHIQDSDSVQHRRFALLQDQEKRGINRNQLSFQTGPWSWSSSLKHKWTGDPNILRRQRGEGGGNPRHCPWWHSPANQRSVSWLIDLYFHFIFNLIFMLNWYCPKLKWFPELNHCFTSVYKTSWYDKAVNHRAVRQFRVQQNNRCPQMWI